MSNLPSVLDEVITAHIEQTCSHPAEHLFLPPASPPTFGVPFILEMVS